MKEIALITWSRETLTRDTSLGNEKLRNIFFTF